MTVDIIVTYSPIPVEPRMSVRKKYLLFKYILHNSKTISLHVCINLYFESSNHLLYKYCFDCNIGIQI